MIFLSFITNKEIINELLILEQEADAEEERQRKERETQQKQNVMTIGETREQISVLESELAQLKHEKHQLFVQLKKVLHEDDNRRRLIKETTYVIFNLNFMNHFFVFFDYAAY